MKYNYHGHTMRCHHARGKDEDYVLEAIKNGYDEIGFSDHAPYIFPKGHNSGFRMSCDDAQDYVDSILSLKDKYKSVISIKLGFEVEYYPELIDREMDFLKSLHYDYIILGQHFTDNEYESWAKYSAHETNNTAILDKYISQVLLAAKSGAFTYIAHPDIINYTADRNIYIKKMTDMVKKLKETGTPLEFNFLGYTTGRNYPNNDFWNIVAKYGNDVVIGLDSHDTEVYSDKENLVRAKEYLTSLGITPLETVKLIGWNYNE